ncbi:hypothetical protein BDZ94DRAFT_1249547 [Collybia nuda]|uniref:Uncharacterized protein n=1 Tax=Collybia nuda TaxID=64659 RepID=A0A9P5YG76_9AGAR|nr:hypothetical protein BDZ94DRAFT_1249547 [Collybia nuda]
MKMHIISPLPIAGIAGVCLGLPSSKTAVSYGLGHAPPTSGYIIRRWGRVLTPIPRSTWVDPNNSEVSGAEWAWLVGECCL